MIPADAGVDPGAKAVSHQPLIVEELDDGRRSAALRDGDGYVFIALAVYCADPGQIEKKPRRQENYDDSDDDQNGLQFAAKNL